ncbi:MAG: hypothetical protein AAGC92_09710 [Pseudomonadota bacterium]
MFHEMTVPVISAASSDYILKNGIFVPSRSLNSLLSPHVEMLFWTWEQYPVNRIGSCTLIEFKERYFAIATSHQIENVDVSEVRILGKERNTTHSSKGLYWIDIEQEEIYSDRLQLRAFDFTHLVEEFGLPSHRFFPLRCSTTVAHGDLIDCAAAFGFPFCQQTPKYEDCDEIGARMTELKMATQILKGSFEDKCTDENCFNLHYRDPIAVNGSSFHPNGMSGGPVFAFVSEGSSISVKLAGITCRGGRGRLCAVKNKWIFNLLSQHFPTTHDAAPYIS